MAKQSGLGDNLYVAGYDLSGDINSLRTIRGGNSPLPMTGINKSAWERAGGVRDGEIELIAYFNPSTDQAHSRYKTLPTTDQIVSYYRGTALGSPAASLIGKQINYDGSRGDDGSFLLTVQALANGYGLEWGEQLTAGKRTDVAPTNGTGVDFAASTAFGLQAYLHVFAFSGTSVTIKIQESSDNGGGDPFADVTGGAFTVVTGVTAERIATAAITVERYLRVVTTGTFSSVTFAVAVAKNATAVSF